MSYGACLLAEQKNNLKFKKIQTDNFYKGFIESKKYPKFTQEKSIKIYRF